MTTLRNDRNTLGFTLTEANSGAESQDKNTLYLSLDLGSCCVRQIPYPALYQSAGLQYELVYLVP
jgi:hypothetical protein